MINSMTGFAREQAQTEYGALQWEIRSVNHRYLDVTFRLPDNLRELEPALREKIQQHLKRGKVECTLQYQPSNGDMPHVELNHTLLHTMKKFQQQIKGTLKIKQSTFIELLRWPDMLKQKKLDLSGTKQAALQLFDHTLETFITARQREGEKIRDMLLSRLEQVLGSIQDVRQALPDILDTQKQRLLNRFEEAKVSLDEERLSQEMVLFAQRMDVDEELDRLETHHQEMMRVLKEDNGAIGRRLDFLLQEFHREANTVGSKAVSPVTSHASVNLKVLIEQMREQVQNIE